MTAASMLIKPSVLSGSGAARREDSDRALVSRCQAGERDAFCLLLSRYRDRIVNLAFQLLSRREDAEDVAQEAFTQAFTSIKNFRGDSQFFTWLYRITVNLCLQRKRRQKPEDCLDDGVESASGTDVESQVVTKLLVERTLAKMSEPLRITLVLRDMQDLSYEEIASILSIPVGTVRSRLNEARRQFRDAWTLAEKETAHP